MTRTWTDAEIAVLREHAHSPTTAQRVLLARLGVRVPFTTVKGKLEKMRKAPNVGIDAGTACKEQR